MSFNLAQEFPELASELVELLKHSCEEELANTVEGLIVLDRCRCGDDFCATTCTPVIDIMVGVESLEASRPAIAVLGKIDYCYFPYRAESMHWFCKPSPSFRTHHLHLVPFQSPLWIERLAFRDYLAHMRRRFSSMQN